MTSDERILKPGQPRWNYEIQRYKDFDDIFCEKGLISILFLACGRPEITRRCLLSTIDGVSKYAGKLEWILMENGHNEDNYLFFQGLNLERKVIIRQHNYGISEAWNQMWAISRGEFAFILENDFEYRSNPLFNFLQTAIDVLNEKPDVGIIQLRAVHDNSEQHGRGKAEYWPWDCMFDELDKKRVKVWHEVTKSNQPYLIANHPNTWNNNPNICRKSIYRECGPLEEAEITTDPRHSETAMQLRTAKLEFIAAQIGELYYHCGQKTTPPI